MNITEELALLKRPRRNRKMEAIRQLVQETRLTAADFIAPLFVLEGMNRVEPVKSMPGVNRITLDLLLPLVEDLYDAGIRAINLFPYIPTERKDHEGTEALRSGNLITKSIAAIKRLIPDMCIMVDIALDPYTTHGHDGLIDNQGHVLNDPTLDVLAKMALLAADSGADVVAPSDMMDGRVAYIRNTLDQYGLQEVGILSYTVKFASAFYGPFRDALGSAPKIGDKKSYQINPANRREALLECALDEAEGADMLLVKPALPYLDVIYKFKEMTHLPVGAYHVSGEYAMIMAAAERGWLHKEKALWESLISIKRAGADFMMSYVATQPELLKKILQM